MLLGGLCRARGEPPALPGHQRLPLRAPRRRAPAPGEAPAAAAGQEPGPQGWHGAPRPLLPADTTHHPSELRLRQPRVTAGHRQRAAGRPEERDERHQRQHPRRYPELALPRGCGAGLGRCQSRKPLSLPGCSPTPYDYPTPESSSRSSATDDFCYVFVVELERGPIGLGMGLIDGVVSSQLVPSHSWSGTCEMWFIPQEKPAKKLMASHGS